METNAFSMSLQNSLPTGNLLIKSLGQIGPRGDNAVWMMTFHIDLLIMSLTSPGDFAQGKWVLYLQAIFCRSMSYVGQAGSENVVWRRIITMTLTRAEVTTKLLYAVRTGTL